MTDFGVTLQGRRILERDLPELVRQLTRIGDALERLADQAGDAPGAPVPDTQTPETETETP